MLLHVVLLWCASVDCCVWTGSVVCVDQLCYGSASVVFIGSAVLCVWAIIHLTLVLPLLLWCVHNIKDSWLFLFLNPWGSSSLLWLWFLPQLLSPLVYILELPPLRIHPLVLSWIYLIFSLSLAYCSLNWGPYFSSNH